MMDFNDEEEELTSEQEANIRLLRRMAPIGTTIYTILRHIIERDGDIPKWIVSLYALENDAYGEPTLFQLDGLMSQTLDMKLKKSPSTYDTGILYTGSGSDVGTDLVEILSQAVWGQSRAYHQKWL